ncbi:MAG TPA: FecR domain-containing protein [Terriglobales bacterium]|nr:FecR domain-containing protein [Terriglobales bacterium]
MTLQPPEYLWDNRGVPDPDVEHLHQLLISYRYNRPLELEVQRKRDWRRWRWPALGLAAAVVAIAVAAAVLVLPHAKPAWRQPAAWQVQALSGAPVVGSASVQNAEMPVGETLQTGPNSSALVRIGRVGRMEVRPNSALRLTRSSGGHYDISLLHGTVSASTWAPPFTFKVDTQSGLVADLGCVFTVSVDADGVGMVRVSSGWVSVSGYRQALIPAGAAAYLRPNHAPGTPFFEDSSPEFQDALQLLDFSVQDEVARSATLTRLLATARRRDVYTLMRLLRQSSGSERERIVDRAMELLPPPPGVTREGILAGNERMSDAWYNQMGMTNVKRWWVHWKDAF